MKLRFRGRSSLPEVTPISGDLLPTMPLRPEDFPLLTCLEVAKMLHLNPKTVERLARLGRLPCYRVGRRVLFSRGDILQWLAERRTGAKCHD